MNNLKEGPFLQTVNNLKEGPFLQTVNNLKEGPFLQTVNVCFIPDPIPHTAHHHPF